MKTRFISPELYKKSVWETIQYVGEKCIPISEHPLCVEVLPSKKDIYDKLGIPDPDTMVMMKLRRLRESYDRHDVDAYVFIHDRPFRFSALLDAKEWALKDDWFACAGSVWIDCEGPGKNAEVWRTEVFTLPDSLLTMTERDLLHYHSLETPVTVYRGATSRYHAKNGLSWTLDKDRAIWFAKRFSKLGHCRWLAEVKVDRAHISSMFFGRGESEVILTKVPKGVKISIL